MRATPSAKAASDDQKSHPLVGDAEDALGASLNDEELAEVADTLGDYASDSGDGAFAEIGGTLDVDQDTIFNQINARAAAWAEDHAAELVAQIDERTSEAVRSAVADGLSEGKTAVQIADDIEKAAAFGERRSSLIANTEIANANSEGALIGFKAAQLNGVNVFKEWMVTELACVVCDANAAQGAIGLDEDFLSGDAAPSAHPWCRCVLVPVVMPDIKPAFAAN